MSPERLQRVSPITVLSVKPRPSSRASAAVMITSDRQLPERAANASEALRVSVDSYSSFNPLLR